VTRRARLRTWSAFSLAVLLMVLVAISIQVLKSPWLAAYIRAKMISVTEESTGGKVEIASFQFDWRRLHATIENFVLHGREGPTDAPLFVAKKIELRLSLLTGLRKVVELNYIGVDQPSVNLIVLRDGQTNIPEPKTAKKSKKNGLETVVDLAIGRITVSNGSATFAEHKVGFSGRGEKLQVQLFYRAATASYQGDFRIGAFEFVPRDGQPLNASVDLPLEITKDRVDLKNASITTRDSQVIVTASLSHIDNPVIDSHVVAHVSLAEVQRTLNLPMAPCKSDTPCFADADVQARFGQHNIQISNARVAVGQTNFRASGANSIVEFNGTLALDETGRLLRISGKPHGEITISGNARNLSVENYSLTADILGHDVGLGNGIRGLESITISSRVAANGKSLDFHNLRVGIFGGEIDGDASLAEFTRFQLNGHIRGLKIRNFEQEITAAGSGYDGVLTGDLQARGDLNTPGTTGIRAQVQLSIAPGSQGVPVSGKLHAAYDGAQNTVRLEPSYLALPHSHLELDGVLNNRIAFDFSSTNLDDLYPALAMTATHAPNEMPVELRSGKLLLHGEATGPLASPNLSVHIDADHFFVQQRAFDRLGLDLAVCSAGVTISKGSLSRQSLLIHFSGSAGLRQWSAGSNSSVMLALDIRNGDIADVLALAGQPHVPARGALNMSAKLDGTFGNPQGTADVIAADGALYDQPFDKLEANIELADQLVHLNSLDVSEQTANLHASGSYTHPRDSLLTGNAQTHVTATGLQLSQIAAVEKQHSGLGGSVQLTVDVAGDVLQSSGSPEFALSSINGNIDARDLRDKTHNYGDLTAHADTSGSSVRFSLDSTLAGASTKVTGRTTLATGYPTTADASIHNLRVESLLALAGKTFPAKGEMTMVAHVSGPLAEPSASGELNLTAASLYDEPINRLQATLRYSHLMVEVPALNVTTPAGTLNVKGSFSHPESQFDTGKFEFQAQTNTVQLAQIRNLRARKPGIAGTLNVAADLAGEIKKANGVRDMSISKVNANFRAAGITYQDRALGNAALIAETKGDGVVITADSNFAGAAIHGEGNAKLEAEYPVTAKVTVANARYSNLRAWLDDDAVRSDVDALLEADATLAGPVRRPEEMKGNLQVTRLELSAAPRGARQAPIALKNEGPIALDYDHGSMRIRSAHLTGKSTDIAVAGAATFSGANSLNLTVKANTGLGLLQDMDRNIHASGSVSVDAVVRGRLSHPLATGTVQLINASVNMESLPNGISNANGVIALSGSRADVRNLTAESGGGKLSLSGFATLTGSAIRYSLNAKAARVRTRYQGMSVVHSAALALGGTSEKALVSGTVTVERVAYNAQSDIGSMLSQLTGSAAPTASGDGSAMAAATRLDIRIRTAPDVRFETTMAQTLQADADLTLGGTLQSPGMVGRVNITQGDLIFFGNEYTVDRGVITFSDPARIDPRISISLETTVESVTVTLGVTGPMNNLKLSYRSDPPLQFQEIVGLLTTGRRPSSDPNIVATEAAPPQQSVAQMGATAIVSQAVASPLSSRLQRVFGVNQLSIDPTFASGSALPQARLSLQQRVANSVTFTYTQDLSQSNSELIRVEWAVDPRFSVVATRDENGIFGVDFFYKRQFQ
jgi:translocation and assembly module TamB